MAGYTKEFLVDAFLWRYTDVLLKKDTKEGLDKFIKMVKDYADSVSIDTFRKYASLDAEEIRKFRLATGY